MKKLFLWSLYDFANSILLMGFLFYFSQWLVIDQGRPAWWYNAGLIIASALFIITAPFVSRRIDATKRKIGGLRIWTCIALVGHIVVALLTILNNDADALILSIYILSTYVYLVCFLYFTPMLNDLSTPEDRSWKSGIGQGANSIGQVVGVLVTLPFANGLTLFGEPGRAQALLPATIIFGILALPMLLFYKEETGPDNQKKFSRSVPAASIKLDLVTMFKEVFRYRPLAFLLLAYFLFSDSLLTFANNFPLYLQTVHNVSDSIKTTLAASILILAAIGAIVLGKVADKKGKLKVLKLVILAWCVIFLAIAFVSNLYALFPIFLLAGLLFGPVWAISRALVGELAPPHLVASTYSYYVVAERFATFIGPAIWSLALVVMDENARGYQVAMISLAVLMIVSFFVLGKIKLTNATSQA
jgi:UMF1 family MFS transporter